ncbi:MAG TPA: class I SAM-dependent methyltransferase [Anaerolineae bacterium]|nr:class I SAM-dependent methyltransferase [Anaerolineae bacterium]
MIPSNLEIYNDPPTYDLESGPFDPQRSFLLHYATAANGPLLELGCGTGRITIPLAQLGLNLTALDILPQMLAHARTKASHLPINWICADVRTFHLNQQYPLIFSRGLLFQHLLARADQNAFFHRIHQHLTPDGTFIIDASFKHPRKMRNSPERQHWYTFTNHLGQKIQVSGEDRYDHLAQIWYQTIYHQPLQAKRSPLPTPRQLALRYYMPQEMESLLRHHNFQILHRYGNWQGDPLREDSFLQIYICQPRL